MAWRSVAMVTALRVAPLAALLAALVARVARASPLQPTHDPPLFEAAFQGRCGEASPCDQLCRELHDGTYECGCSPGYVLHVNGYGCLELNATSKYADEFGDTDEDVLYQKDVSFSAELEVALPSTSNSKTFVDTSITRKHIERNGNYAVTGDETTELPKHISEARLTFKEKDISYIGEKYKQMDGVKSLISDGVSENDINMIADDSAKLSDDDLMMDGSSRAKVTTLGPSLEQKVPGGTSSPPWTAPVDVCNCDVCHTSRASCRCPLTSTKCSRDVRIVTPRFSGASWLALRALRGAYKRVRLRARVRPERARGVLLLTGEHDDLSGDYLALVLHQGHVELRFDCGSGAGILRSPEPVRLGRWNTISVYRHRWDAWLKLNDGKKVRGRSKGLFSRMTFREPVWVGGAGNTTGLQSKLGLSDGLLGCMDFLRINGATYRLTSDAVATTNVGECAPSLAPWKTGVSPTIETARIRNHPNEFASHAYDINDIVHFEDNDIVMRDASTEKKMDSRNDVDNSVDQFKNKDDNKGDVVIDELTNDFSVNDLKELDVKCRCEHGGGCIANVCLCPLGYSGVHCEITLDLKVPRFNGSSYLRLPGLGNTAVSWLDIQITLKPTSATGLVLYNADHVSGDGDFFSLHLREYYVEFAFDLGSGIALVRSAYPLTPNAWHRVSISRSGRRATLRVRTPATATAIATATATGDATRSVTSRGTARKLTLRQPLMLGGAPRPLPPRLALSASYSGCVSQLVINDEEISVVSSALGGVNVDNCDEPTNITCGIPASCDQQGESIPEYMLQNVSETSAHRSIVAKKGLKSKHHRAKSKKYLQRIHAERYKSNKKYGNTATGDREAGNIERSNEVVTGQPRLYDGRYMQIKYMKPNEINWGDTNTYPSFTGTDSFIHMDDEETMKRLLSYTLDINIRFRCVGPHGLLVWSGRTSPHSGDDFLSLGIENSVLVFRYDLGSGEVVIIANHTRVDDGLWHRARATRNRQAGVLEVDGLGSVGKMSPGKLKQLNTDNGLYIGGLPSIEINTMGKYTCGLVGCVSQISLSGDFDIPLSLSKLPHTITNNVGRCTT